MAAKHRYKNHDQGHTGLRNRGLNLTTKKLRTLNYVFCYNCVKKNSNVFVLFLVLFLLLLLFVGCSIAAANSVWSLFSEIYSTRRFDHLIVRFFLLAYSAGRLVCRYVCPNGGTRSHSQNKKEKRKIENNDHQKKGSSELVSYIGYVIFICASLR